LRDSCSAEDARSIVSKRKKKNKEKEEEKHTVPLPGRQALTTGNTYLFPARGGTTSFYLRTDNKSGTNEKTRHGVDECNGNDRKLSKQNNAKRAMTGARIQNVS